MVLSTEELAKITALKAVSEDLVNRLISHATKLKKISSSIADDDFSKQESVLNEKIQAVKTSGLLRSINQDLIGKDNTVIEEITNAALKLAEECNGLTDELNALIQHANEISPKKSTATHSHAVSQPQTPSASEAEKLWLTDQVIETVSATLESLSKSEDDATKSTLATTLRTKYETYKQTKDSKDRQFMYDVVHMPGFGHVKAETLRYISQEELQRRKSKAAELVEAQTLPGTEDIVRKFLTGHFSDLFKMIHADESMVGKPLPASQNTRDKLCAYGPPGTGKTSMAKMFAAIEEKPFVLAGMDTAANAEAVLGRGKQWTAGHELGLIAQTMVTRKRKDLFIFLDELDKAPADIIGQLGDILGSQSKYRNPALETYLDLSECTFFAAANDLYRIPKHIRDRLTIVHQRGYDDDEKVQILSTMVVKQLSTSDHHEFISFGTNDTKKCSLKCPDGQDFHGFTKSTQDEPLRFIIENYSEEEGARKLEPLLTKILTEARSKSFSTNPFTKVVIDNALVIRALGPVDPSVKAIKDSEKTIIMAKQELANVVDTIERLLAEHASTPLSGNKLNELQEAFTTFDEKVRKLTLLEKQIIRWIAERQKNPNADQEALSEKLASHQTTLDKLPEFLSGIKTKQSVFEQSVDLSVKSTKLDAAPGPGNLSPPIDPEPLSTPLNPAHHVAGAASHKPPAVTIDSSIRRAPSIAIDQQYNPLSFDFARRAQKVSAKNPKVVVSSAESFKAFCASEQRKIIDMAAIRDNVQFKKTVENLHKLPDSTEQATDISQYVDNTPLAKHQEEKRHGTPLTTKYSSLERVKHKANTALMYKDLTCEITDENTFIVQRKLSGDAKKDIIAISRDEAANKTHIAAKDFNAENQDLWLMVEYARDHSTSGKFTITDCEHNETAAIKLFVFGKLAKLDPELPEATKKAIDEYLGKPNADAQLKTMYEAAIHTPLERDILMKALQTWQRTEAAAKRKGPSPHSL